MKVLHINAGLENGGGLYHIINLLSAAKMRNKDYELLTLAAVSYTHLTLPTKRIV